MASRLSAVVDVRMARPGESVYGLFKECGIIKSLHSWKKPSEPEVAHYFVVFADATSVPRAVNAPAVLAAGASVTPVEAQADLAVTYMQIHPEDSDADRVPPQASTSSAVTSTETMLPLPVPAARAPEPVANGTGVAAPSRVASAFLRDVQEYARSSRPERTWTTSTSADRPSSSTAGMRPLDFKFGTNVIDFSTGFPTALDLPYMGAVVHVDLASMDGANPRPLIALLAKTGAERAAWMLAGAFLRQTGHPASACAVVSAMVEAMTKAGTPEVDLKPAFLFLSGCHTDSARRAGPAAVPSGWEAGPSSPVPTSAPPDHTAEAKYLLQKVYGTQRPEPPRPTPAPAHTSRPQENGKTNNKRGRQQTSVSEVQIMQREIQSLRDRNEHLTRQLRKAERAADDVHGELATERAARRQAEAAAEAARRDLQLMHQNQRTTDDAREAAFRRVGEQAPVRLPLPPASVPMVVPLGMPDPSMLVQSVLR